MPGSWRSYTEAERADLMFGIKVALADVSGSARAGLPATVRLESTPAPLTVVAEARP